MKVKDLIEFLNVFDKDDEIEIEVYETETGSYVDTTAAVTVADIQTALGPVLQIDVEANKFKKFL